MGQLKLKWTLKHAQPVMAQGSLRIAQTPQRPHCLYTQSMEADEDSDGKPDMHSH